MSVESITIHCPVCDREFEIECEYQGAEPDVGIMSGGPIPSDDVPVECDECETKFSAEQIAALRKRVVQVCEDWQPPDDEPDFYDE